MANTMDSILVQYGTSMTNDESWAILIGDTKTEELKSKIKTVTIPEFLAVKPEELSAVEQKIQRAIRLIYDLNGKDPPLYKKFPDFRSDKKPLTIDITTAGRTGKDFAAAFESMGNKILFEEIDRPDDVIRTLAHELKHAEQCDEEILDKGVAGKFSPDFAYAWHQLGFLKEAQAYAFDGRVYYEIFGHGDHLESKLYEEISKKYTDSNGHKDEQKIEEEMVSVLLDRLYNSAYKDSYDLDQPIGENDKGIDCIPDAFHLPQSLMKKINEAPRIARSPQGKLLQAAKNGRVDEYLRLIKEGIEKKEKISPSLDVVFEKGTETQAQEALDIRKEDGAYLFDDKAIKTSFAFEKINPGVIKYLMTAKRDGQELITPKDVAEKLSRVIQEGEGFHQFCAVIQDEKGQIPLTEKDCLSEYGSNKLLQWLTVGSKKSRENLVQMLPKVLKMKGSDGNPLVGEKQLAEELGEWSSFAGSLKDLQDIFKSITDEKGNLILSREAFDIRGTEYRNGQNWLLKSLRAYEQEDKKYSQEILPFLMSLKDRDGRPIISQENIERYDNDELEKDVKAYLKPQESSAEQKKGISGRLNRLGQPDKSENSEISNETMAAALKKRLPQAGD